MKAALVAIVMALAAPALAQPRTYFDRQDAGPITGTEIVGPVRQSNTDVRITIQQLKDFVNSGGVRFTGDQSLAVTPQGSPLASRASVWRSATSVNVGLQQFFFGSECLSQNAASSLGGNVCEYSYIKGTAGSGGVWSRSDVVELTSAFPYSTHSAIAHEIDINNSAADRSDFTVANNVGLLLNGLGKRNTAAISIQTGNTSPVLPIWYHGLYFGTNSVSQYAIRDASNASTSILIEGTHAGVGLDMSTATIGGLGIRLGVGAMQGLGARNGAGGTTYGVLYADAQGYAHIGTTALSNAYSDGHFNPSIDASFNLGAVGARWAHVLTNVVDVPVGSTAGVTATPVSTAYTLLYADSSGRAHLGSQSLGSAYVDGNLIPNDTAYALGQQSTPWDGIYVRKVNAVPVPSVGTPASAAAACVPSQTMMDASFAYFCVASNTWRRVAIAAW